MRNALAKLSDLLSIARRENACLILGSVAVGLECVNPELEPHDVLKVAGHGTAVSIDAAMLTDAD